MTTITAPLPHRRSADLAGLLRLDAVTCAASGALAVAAAPAVADALGPDVPTTAVRVVGVALLLWAVDVGLLSRASGRLLRRGTAAVAGVNVAWEVATVVLVAAGAFSVGGAVLALAVAAVVGGLGLLQLRALRRQDR
jgi:hypothetical protein